MSSVDLERHRRLMIEQLDRHQPLDGFLRDMLSGGGRRVESYADLPTEILAGMIFGGVDKKIVEEFNGRREDLPDDIASMLHAVVQWKAEAEEKHRRRG